MAFLFGRRQRNPLELVKATKDLMHKLNQQPENSSKSDEDVVRNLQLMKVTLIGTPESDPDPAAINSLIDAFIREDFLHLLVASIHNLPFESRKDAQVVLSTVFRFTPEDANEPISLSYIVNRRPETVITLCHGYDRRESAAPCGAVLREALKHDAVAALILYDEDDGRTDSARSKKGIEGIDVNKEASGNGVFWRFFNWIDHGSFELSADAFNTFRDILMKHRKLTATWLQTNFTLFFETYNRVLIQSKSYVTKRQSIKLLGEILLERSNYNVMTKYVESGDYLKICMNLLRDERKMVNYESFHIFKIFVANPNKSAPVRKILINNREKLLKFLPDFLNDRKEDDQFNDEKSFLIKQIEALPPQWQEV